MKSLNFLELRALIKSNRFNIDINPNLFNHPRYKNQTIPDLDYSIKNFSFKKKFQDIINSSINDGKIDELSKEFDVSVKMVLSPLKAFINVREFSGWKRYLKDTLNHFRQTPFIKIKKRSTVVVPISLTIQEGTSIPEFVLILSEKLQNLGLIATGTIPAYKGQQLSFVSIYNTSDSTVLLKDLVTLGVLRFTNK